MAFDNRFMSLILVVAIKTISQPNQIALLIHTLGVEILIDETISSINLNYISKNNMIQVSVHVCNLEMLDKKTQHMRSLINCASNLNAQYYSLLLKRGWSPNMSRLKSFTQNIKIKVVSINGEGIMTTLFIYHDIIYLI